LKKEKEQISMFAPIEPAKTTKCFKNVVRCKSCGKKIEIDNGNRELCNKCGYKNRRARK